MNKLFGNINASDLAKKLGVHYKTVLFWFKKNRLPGAKRSLTSNEILIPDDTVRLLMENRGIVQKKQRNKKVA
jgi:hypothetical protein